jgi:hypothetical protein
MGSAGRQCAVSRQDCTPYHAAVTAETGSYAGAGGQGNSDGLVGSSSRSAEAGAQQAAVEQGAACTESGARRRGSLHSERDVRSIVYLEA